MAVYLFTYHAYGSWLPDRPRGYVRHGRGVQHADREAALGYRSRMSHPPVRLTSALQQTVVAAVKEKCEIKGLTLHAVTTDVTHIHVLTAWEPFNRSKLISRGLHASITRQLNAAHHRRPWLTRGGSRRRIRTREHFEYLIHHYLPRHDGCSFYRHRRRA